MVPSPLAGTATDSSMCNEQSMKKVERHGVRPSVRLSLVRWEWFSWCCPADVDDVEFDLDDVEFDLLKLCSHSQLLFVAALALALLVC